MDIVEFILKYKVWGLIGLLVVAILWLFIILLDEDRSNIWRGRFYKVLYKLSKRREAEKKYIANDVAGRLNLARREMPFGKDLIPKSLKVEWIEGSSGQNYVLKEGELVVKLDPAEAQEKNIIFLARALIQKTALIGIRYILEKPLEDTIDLNLIKNLLSAIGNRTILDWYMKYEYTPKIEENEKIKDLNSKIVEIDERGLFTRLLLVELDSYGVKISGRPKSSEMEEEIRGLIEFLYRIATKNYGENAPLNYITRNIKIGILIVGETSKILSSIDPYIKAFICHLKKQVESIYVLSFSKEFLREKDEESEKAFEEMRAYLHKRIERDFKVEEEFELTYYCYDIKGRKRKAKCVRYIPIYA
jgi:small subunit ribosomal protein S1